MPELPDVEVIKNELLPQVVGRHFCKVTLRWPRAIIRPSAEQFCQQLVGQTIEGLGRRGKYLIFHLSSGEALILHLRMSGSLLFKSASDEPAHYTRTVFTMDKGMGLDFIDQRKLGVMWLVANESEVIDKLGPEPLSLDFTPEVLFERLRNRKASIKALLCEQSFVAGIGNMYADEILFAAKIHPLYRGKDLSEKEVMRLHNSTRQILWNAIDGARAGRVQFSFCVAHRGGEPCPLCSTQIQRIRIRNRGTYFCPQCQVRD
jgi:formamidopyrimidine-DNA glycosylase